MKFRIVQGGEMPLQIDNDRVVSFRFRLFVFGLERKYSVIDLNAWEYGPQGVLLRIQSECWWGRAGSAQCDCEWQFRESKKRIVDDGSGLIIFCHDQIGKGIGLSNHYKVHDFAVSAKENPTPLYERDIWYDGFERAGMPVENRHWEDVIDILKFLKIERVRLLTNSPFKIQALQSVGLSVERVVLFPNPNKYNIFELEIKKRLGGHLYDHIS